MEANLTVCLPYILFYVCEHHSVHVSGILALVAMGLYMTNRGRTRISTESEETIHAIWHYIGFAAETLIFTLTGFILGGEFVTDTFKPLWVLQLFGLYIFLHIIRFVGLVMLMPLLRLTGYEFGWKEVILLTYSGLRGAVGLCLAL
jgi:NhaP-type Na+/H+ or K+/H+ antiporter